MKDAQPLPCRSLDSPALWAGQWNQLCVSCKIVRPLRAKHCSITGRCVEVWREGGSGLGWGACAQAGCECRAPGACSPTGLREPSTERSARDGRQAQRPPRLPLDLLLSVLSHAACKSILQANNPPPARPPTRPAPPQCYDHYCPWVGNCVGKGNRHHFLIFLWLELAAILLSTLVAVARIHSGESGRPPARQSLSCRGRPLAQLAGS